MVVVAIGTVAVVVVLEGAGSVVAGGVSVGIVVVVVVVLVVVVEVVVVVLVVVEVTVVVVAGSEVVVAADGLYDQTYCGPGFPSLQASQSVQVGRSPESQSASGCSIAQEVFA